jgi:hypothetical protein
MISLMTIFWKQTFFTGGYFINEYSILIKILAWTTLTAATFNLVAGIFAPGLKQWKFYVYIAFAILNCSISFVTFIISQFVSGRSIAL